MALKVKLSYGDDDGHDNSSSGVDGGNDMMMMLVVVMIAMIIMKAMTKTIITVKCGHLCAHCT